LEEEFRAVEDRGDGGMVFGGGGPGGKIQK
jgi:hypothetical protein